MLVIADEVADCSDGPSGCGGGLEPSRAERDDWEFRGRWIGLKPPMDGFRAGTVGEPRVAAP